MNEITIAGRTLTEEEAHVVRAALKYWGRRFAGRADAQEAKVRRLAQVRGALGTAKSRAERTFDEMAVQFRRVQRLAEYLHARLVGDDEFDDDVREYSAHTHGLDLARYQPVWGYSPESGHVVYIGAPEGGWTNEDLERFAAMAADRRKGGSDEEP